MATNRERRHKQGERRRKEKRDLSHFLISRRREKNHGDVQRPGVHFGRHNPHYEDNRRETFDHRKAVHDLRKQLKLSKQKCNHLFHRLEVSFDLLRKEKKRYAEVTGGKTRTKKGDDINFRFECGWCKRAYSTFTDLMTHTHEIELGKIEQGKIERGKIEQGDDTDIDVATVDEFTFDDFGELTL